MATTPEKPERDNTPDLSALLNRDSEDSKKESKYLRRIKISSRRKRVALITTLSVAIVALFVTVIVYDPFTNSLRWGTPGPNQVDIGANPDGPSKPIYQPQWYEEPENQYPVPIQNWQKTPYTEDKRDTLLEEAYKVHYGTGVGMSASGLPSESTGFTSDLSKQYLENGDQNPRFSYWTNEVFTREVGLMLERLTKPSLGGWEAAQFGREANLTLMDDLFTDRFRGTMRSNPSNYPILIETYGENLLQSGSRWVGEVTGFQMTLSFNGLTGQYGGTAKVDILYTAWTEDKTKVTKTATLTLRLVSNAGNAGNGSSNRVLIDGATLVVN